MKRIVGASFLLLFALLWGAAVGVGDVMLCWAIYKQHASASWPTAEGTVTRSDMRTSRGSKGGTKYHADVRYAYSVNGRGYQGDRIAFGIDMLSGSQAAANDWLNRFPPSSHPPVHYNPENPAESTLSTDLLPDHGFMVLLLIPFNAAFLGFGSVALGSLRRAITRPPAGGLRVIEDASTTLIRVSWWSPFYTALIVSAILSFIAMVVVGAGFKQSLPVGAMFAVVGAVLLAGLIAGALAYTVGPKSDKYIVLDSAAGTLTIPAMGGKKQPTTLDFLGISSISSREERRGKSTIYYLCINALGPNGEPVDSQWQLGLAKDRVSGLVEFLENRLGLVRNS